ncbi:flagellar biosynthetic protein FliQ [Acidomonas methanolica]|uniref:Flagellar biosynthetic export protein fliQ n=1 Tax=Acidomonas methanolica NBRC 104435 TaxID=1231351 RepID=A0A023D4G2_ACIMT|nr:flagellar biosynthetic protein FliQ [Acidomonas methanolica]MBU2654322.1 flagellar biosynthetic protein FliQ [Acidomonas methanolica]TCS29239.1 flagellar biosynthetic protein FliQ [Acidomonas methanolica]GAJ28964.1 flagellar biosynthetic export protein fliQ [Acidomonas methanolica NBRC 104435]GBQ51210.1 flagellar biosynthetic protein FliQ [Acidomonas methanolica]GEK99261.1 flagellar export apparatus protein FliQ [Acidomonas methanolica NBRC 104435]
MQAVDLRAILHETLMIALKLSAPSLIVALGVGLVIAVFQAVTQINEATLAFVPKVIAIGVVMMVTGSFMTGTLIAFGRFLFDQMILVGGT